jgi:hypothetical protein
MSRTTPRPGAKGASVVAAGVLLTMSVGSASASTPAPAISIDTPAHLPVSFAQPASWRDATPMSSSARTAVITPAVAMVVSAPRAFATGTAAIQASRAATTRTAKAAVFTAYTAFSMKSSATRDMRGVEPSLYRGKYYRTAVESRRLCIVRRESEGHYDVVNPSGSYRGAYQVSGTLARGATHMMLKEHKALMGDANAKRVLAQLRKTPINKWPRYWQDALFSTVANWDHTGSGVRHWAGGRWHC